MLFQPPGDLPDPRIEPMSLMIPALAGGFFTTSTTWEVPVECSSVQLLSRVRLCDPMDCSTPGFPVHNQILEPTQTHLHQVGDAIQLSYPLSSPSPPTFNLSQHKCFFKESVLCIKWPNYQSFSFSITHCSEYSGLISFRIPV